MFSSAHCTTNIFELGPIDLPAFSFDFIETLKVLERANGLNSTQKDKIFTMFIQDYGTHYITKGAFGAKVCLIRFFQGKLLKTHIYFQFIMERGFSKKGASDSKATSEKNCIDTVNNIDLFIAKISHSESNCQSETNEAKSLDIEEIAVANYKTVGAPPARSLDGKLKN